MLRGTRLFLVDVQHHEIILQAVHLRVEVLIVGLIVDHHAVRLSVHTVHHLAVHLVVLLLDHVEVMVVDTVTHQDDLVGADVDVKNQWENLSMYQNLSTVLQPS